MPRDNDPVVLDLAPLPREQVGPFLLLGVPKTASKDRVEAHWAKRVIWARKQQLKVALEDINWARDFLSDGDKRARADAASLNADTSDGIIEQIAKRYNATGEEGPTWQPLDVEKPLADYAPAIEVPDHREVSAGLTIPDVPEEVPAVSLLLEQLVQQPIDPWALTLPE